jgi:cbb3-type cytochrome oxidase maturation protein
VSVVYILVPLALLIVLVAIGAYAWAAKRGQFDDLETPAVRMLHDDADTGSATRDPERNAGPHQDDETP